MPKGDASPGRGVIALAFVIASAALLAMPGLRGWRKPRLASIAERGPARELTMTTIDGLPWRLSDQRGEVVAMNLWATWCGPCRAETPALVRLSHELEGSGLRVVGVSLDTGNQRVEHVRSFAAVYHVSYPLALPDPLSQLDQAVEGLPTTLLFDREGRLAMTYVGAIRANLFREDVEQLLAER